MERCTRLAFVRAQIDANQVVSLFLSFFFVYFDTLLTNDLFEGTYARDRDISIEESVVDSALWKKLDGHNDFIANQIKSLSQSV